MFKTRILAFSLALLLVYFVFSGPNNVGLALTGIKPVSHDVADFADVFSKRVRDANRLIIVRERNRFSELDDSDVVGRKRVDG